MMLTLLLTLCVMDKTLGHMSLQEPPARNVMWRMGFPELPQHKDDDYLICTESPGAPPCPPCGDSADTPPPHPHQGGGKWATGIITRSYNMGQNIQVQVNVSRSHGGFLEFKLCPHNRVSKPVSQECLNRLPLDVVGQRTRKVKISAPYDSPEMLTFDLRLPPGLTCNQCVLQMSNTAEQFKPQTIMFRNCADISITNSPHHKSGLQPGFHGSQPGFSGSQSGFPGSQSGFPGSQSGFPGSQSVFPGSQPGFPGSQPGFPGSQPGFPGSQPGFPGSQPGFPGSQPGFPGSQSGFPASQSGFPRSQPGFHGSQPGFHG